MTLTEAPPRVESDPPLDRPPAEPASVLRQDAGLFAISASVLTLEILQFKIFAYSLDAIRIYLAVGVCLLGLGASGTLLSILPRFGSARATALAAFFAALGGLMLPPVHALFARFASSISEEEGPGAIVTLLALTLPYFCFGMTISLLLVSRAAKIGRAYAVNLGGSALGCLFAFPLLETLGAERAVAWAGLMAVGAACLLYVPKSGGWRIALAAAAAALALSVGFAKQLIELPPDPTGQLAVVLRSAAKIEKEHPGSTAEIVHEYVRWDRTARVDVYDLKTTLPELQSSVGGPIETRFFVQDSSAGSFLLGVGDDIQRGKEFFEGTLYGAAYKLAPRENVLLIGLGGAPDVLTAEYFGVDQVAGVDINGSTIELVKSGPYKDFLGDPYGRPGVTIHQMDGRTFLRASEDKYDLIQMSGVDTKSVLASGSLSVNENYVYTIEAMSEMLARIEDDGVICFLRFDDPDAHKLASVAIAGLRELGITNVADHLFALRQGFMRSVLIKRTPFSAEEVENLHAWAEAHAEPPDITIPTYDWIDVGFRHPISVMYSPKPRPYADTDYFHALVSDQHDVFLETFYRDLRSPTDDRPFFFFRERLVHFLPAIQGQVVWALINRPSVYLQALFRTIGRLALVSAVLILVPLIVLRGRGLRTPKAARSIVYFSALGMGFMLFEIGLMHRFVLLLGHQSYAITVVLLGLLVGASLGSTFSGRLSITAPGHVRKALLALVGVILLASFLLGDVFVVAATLGFGARLALALSILVVIGFLLGIPFPTALRALERESQPVVPWGLGINGFASVVGSTIAVPTAMLFGLRSLLFIAAALYLFAFLTVPIGAARTERSA